MSGQECQVVLIKGSDPILVAAGLKASMEKHGADPDATEEFDAELEQIPQAIEACLTVPFLSPRRYVVVRNLGGLKAEELSPLISYLSEPSPTSVLFLAGGGGTLSPVLGKAVSAAGGETVETAVQATGKGRSEWFAKAFKDSGIALDAQAKSMIVEHLGEDVGRLGSLLAVLRSAFGEETRIGPFDVEPYLGEAGGVAPWDLTDAIDAGDVAKALWAAHRMMEAGDRHPLAVLSILHRHYSSMLKLTGGGVASEDQAAQMLGMKSFPAGKLLRQANKLGYSKVARAILLLSGADLDLKGSSGWEPALVIEVLVARLARLR